MTSVTRSRIIQADPETVKDVITDDVPGFIRAAGYDSVTLDGERIGIEQRLGLATLSLTLRPTEDEQSTLAFEQESGLFEEMTMQYVVEPTLGGAELTARTTFTLGGVTGSVLDERLVRRQRTSEIEDQFDYLEREIKDRSSPKT